MVLVSHPYFYLLQSWLELGNKQRATAATAMNDKSSRSHSVFTLVMTQTKVLLGVRYLFKLCKKFCVLPRKLLWKYTWGQVKHKAFEHGFLHSKTYFTCALSRFWCLCATSIYSSNKNMFSLADLGVVLSFRVWFLRCN